MKSKLKKKILGMRAKEFDDYLTHNLPIIEVVTNEDGTIDLTTDSDGKFLLARAFDMLYDASTVAELSDSHRKYLPKGRSGILRQKDKAALIIWEAMTESFGTGEDHE